MKTSAKILLALSVLIFSTLTLAKHGLPTFTGSWYTNATYLNLDNCSLPQYRYENKLTGDAKTIANNLLQNVPTHNDCRWNEPYLYKTIEQRPIDFIGNDTDWQQIILEQGNLVQLWRHDCVGNFSDHKEITIYPAYQCPSGTHYGFSQENGYGCVDTAYQLCNADIIGRDMKREWMAKIGHLGITTDIYPVVNPIIEVLEDTNPAIQIDPFEGFKTATIFWGDKYGVAGAPFLTAAQSTNIVKAAMDQTLCDSTKYDFNPIPHPQYMPCDFYPPWGKIAKFRCDTLVTYSYLKGADIKIDAGYPEDFFTVFMFCRLIGDMGSKCPDSQWLQRVSPTSVASGKTIQELLAQPDTDLIELQNNLDSYLATNGISRLEKLKYILSLASEYESNTLKFQYLTQYLYRIHTIELTDEFISEFYKQNDNRNKSALMFVLVNLTVNDTESQTFYAKEKLENVAATNIVKIKKFFADVLSKEENSTVLQDAILFYPHVLAPLQAKADIDAVFMRADIDGKKLKSIMFANSPFCTHQLAMTLSSPEMQQKYLVSLLQDVIVTHNESTFDKSLFYYFTDADFYPPKFGFDSSNLADMARLALLKYLSQRNYEFNVNDYPSLSPMSANSLEYQWLETRSAISASNREGKYQKISDYIRSVDDLNHKSQLLYFATNGVMQQFSTQELTSLAATLNSKLRTLDQMPKQLTAAIERQRDIERKFLQMGLSRINQVLQARDQKV